MYFNLVIVKRNNYINLKGEFSSATYIYLSVRMFLTGNILFRSSKLITGLKIKKPLNDLTFKVFTI